MAAIRRGAQPVAVEWDALETFDQLSSEQIPGWVTSQVAPVVSHLDPATTIVLGKSLGSYAAGLVTELGLPAVWVTPVLISEAIVAGLRRSTSPFLLAGGTADRLWDSATAHELTRQVLEIENADHGLFDPGPLDRSADNIGKLAAACERFLDEVVWPV